MTRRDHSHTVGASHLQGAPPEGCVIACVTGAPSSEAVVREACSLASALGTSWHAVHVGLPAPANGPREGTSAMPHLALAEALGATAETVSAPSVLDGVLTQAERRRARHVVVGAGPEPRALVGDLIRSSRHFVVHVVPPEEGASTARTFRVLGHSTPRWSDPVMAVAAVASATALAWLARGSMAEADLVLIYLSALAVASVWLHRVSAIGTAILSVVAFNFFFVEPRGSFAVAHVRYLLTFAVMTVAGVVVSTTATRWRDRARAERERSQRMAILLDATRGLTSASTLDQAGQVGLRSIEELTGARVSIELRSTAATVRMGDLALGKEAPASNPPAVAGWAEGEGWHRVEVEASGVPVGAATIAAGTWDRNPAARQVVRAALALVGAAVDRLVLDEQARAARLSAEIEQTRSDLLSSVSHDLRTPLATIKGAATALLASHGHIDDGRRARLLADVDTEADRLGRMLANLLDLSRLQGKDFAAAGDWNAPEDVVGSALHAARGLLAGRDVRTRLPDTVSLVWMDPLLVTQALVNLLDNAVRHATKGPIDVDVTVNDTGATFEIADRGPGFGEGDPERWFKRFERSPQSGGSGLGLSITRAVVELHGGRIEAGDRPGGGAMVRLFLPTGGPRGEIPPSWADAEEVTHE